MPSVPVFPRPVAFSSVVTLYAMIVLMALVPMTSGPILVIVGPFDEQVQGPKRGMARDRGEIGFAFPALAVGSRAAKNTRDFCPAVNL